MAFAWPNNGIRRSGLLPGHSIVVAALDIGSTKICCIVARLRSGRQMNTLPGRTHQIEVLGLGYHLSKGIRGGSLTNLEAAECAVRAAVDQAERRSGVTIDVVLVNVSCSSLESLWLSATTAVPSGQIAAADVDRAISATTGHANSNNQSVMHAFPMMYRIDGTHQVEDPLNMVGQEVAVDTHLVRAENSVLKNLVLLVERCHLQVSSMVATPYASGLATITEDEAELGVVCIDMGGGTTSLAFFDHGQLVHLDMVAKGSHHITLELARHLSVSLSEAERLKTLAGHACYADTDENEAVPAALLAKSDHGDLAMTRAQLTRIIAPRIRELFEEIRERINTNTNVCGLTRTVILTGGGCLLPGVADVCRQILERPTRLARPLGTKNLPKIARGPAFSTAVGLLVYPQMLNSVYFQPLALKKRPLTLPGGRFYKMKQWIRDSF